MRVRTRVCLCVHVCVSLSLSLSFSPLPPSLPHTHTLSVCACVCVYGWYPAQFLHALGYPISNKIVLLVLGSIAKLHCGELVEEARDIMLASGEPEGPLQPRHMVSVCILNPRAILWVSAYSSCLLPPIMCARAGVLGYV